MIGIRLRVAASLLKALLLGDLNIPGKHQTRTVLDRLYELGISEGCVISTRGWERWLSPEVGLVAPKLAKIAVMDEAHSLLNMPLWPDRQGFQQLVCGGLVRSLLAPTRSKKVWPILAERAAGYCPISPLHLHLDALELLSLHGDCLGEHTAAARQLAATRIFECLHTSWNPRDGKVFEGFFSDWRLRWDAVCSYQRAEMKEACEKIRPNPMQKRLAAGVWPDWSRVAVPVDIASVHVYKILFNLPADASFLVGERLERWAIDSVTALLALFAHAWADRYKKFLIEVTPEMAYFIALEAVFLREEPLSELQRELVRGTERCEARWSSDSLNRFQEGRSEYSVFLSRMGLSIAEVAEGLSRLRKAEPLVLQPERSYLI